jgi:predicted ester cyclase
VRRCLSAVPLLVLLFFSSVACQDKAARAELETYKAQQATEAQNKELVRSFFSAIDRNDFGKLEELCARDFSLPAPGLPEPLRFDGLVQAIKTHYAAFPDWKHRIDDMIAEGDKVAITILQGGSHKGAYEGIAPTQAAVTLRAQCVVVVANGKVKELRVVEDYLDFLRQLGQELKPKDLKAKAGR